MMISFPLVFCYCLYMYPSPPQSWLPAMSVLEVLAREAGRRRVPGPVLRAPPAPAAERAPRPSSAAPAHKYALYLLTALPAYLPAFLRTI